MERPRSKRAILYSNADTFVQGKRSKDFNKCNTPMYEYYCSGRTVQTKSWNRNLARISALMLPQLYREFPQEHDIPSSITAMLDGIVLPLALARTTALLEENVY
jgi:hypothetical protein